MSAASVELLRQYRDSGDQEAVERFLQRHLGRLVGMVRARLSPRLRQRLDPEDVAQSACCSFCVRIRDGRIDVEVNDEPGALLAWIATCKLRANYDFHTAAKRSIHREAELGPGQGEASQGPEAADPRPTAEEVAAVEEERDLLLKGFRQVHRDMVELRLQGYQVREIAKLTERTERLVSDVLRHFRERLKRRAAELTASVVSRVPVTPDEGLG